MTIAMKSQRPFRIDRRDGVRVGRDGKLDNSGWDVQVFDGVAVDIPTVDAITDGERQYRRRGRPCWHRIRGLDVALLARRSDDDFEAWHVAFATTGLAMTLAGPDG